MITIEVKEDKAVVDFDYIVSSLEDLDKLMKVIYKPIIGIYHVSLELNDMKDIKFLLNNQSRFNHLDLHLILSEKKYKDLSLALPNAVRANRLSMFDYLMEGISKRGLLIKKNIVYLIYSSIDKSYEEIDNVLDTLYDNYGSFMQITEKDVSKYIVINKTVYPRTVLLEYINLKKYRKKKLEKCIQDISPDIVLAAMIKNIKKLHKEKEKYLKTGIGSKFISELNTKNLNLLYYTLVVNKSYFLNDITILLEIYERGININDLLFR